MSTSNSALSAIIANPNTSSTAMFNALSNVPYAPTGSIAGQFNQIANSNSGPNSSNPNYVPMTNPASGSVTPTAGSTPYVAPANAQSRVVNHDNYADRKAFSTPEILANSLTSDKDEQNALIDAWHRNPRVWVDDGSGNFTFHPEALSGSQFAIKWSKAIPNPDNADIEAKRAIAQEYNDKVRAKYNSAQSYVDMQNNAMGNYNNTYNGNDHNIIVNSNLGENSPFYGAEGVDTINGMIHPGYMKPNVGMDALMGLPSLKPDKAQGISQTYEFKEKRPTAAGPSTPHNFARIVDMSQISKQLDPLVDYGASYNLSSIGENTKIIFDPNITLKDQYGNENNNSAVKKEIAKKYSQSVTNSMFNRDFGTFTSSEPMQKLYKAFGEWGVKNQLLERVGNNYGIADGIKADAIASKLVDYIGSSKNSQDKASQKYIQSIKKGLLSMRSKKDYNNSHVTDDADTLYDIAGSMLPLMLYNNHGK